MTSETGVFVFHEKNRLFHARREKKFVSAHERKKLFFRNKIERLPPGSIKLVNLELLDLSYNYLKTIPETFLQLCQALAVLRLEGNELGRFSLNCFEIFSTAQCALFILVHPSGRYAR